MEWWLPLVAFRANARARCEALQRRGVRITFRGARRIYRAARDGVVYC
jgi:hypothetical protein